MLASISSRYVQPLIRRNSDHIPPKWLMSGFAHDRPAGRAGAHLEDAVELEDAERLAQRAPPGVEVLHHHDLGLERVAVLEVRRRDPVDEQCGRSTRNA